MSTTTEILFNSPALHSLKRDQLVKLCKIHSIKASGKNVDLIQKLRRHAKTLPKDSPLSIAARSESTDSIPVEADTPEAEAEEIKDDASYRTTLPRQSEQWEMVMDSIEEEEEGSSQGTMSSQRTLNGGTGEFGAGSSKPTSVGSSIKALATTLGLKRGNSKASTASSKHSAALPPQEDGELALKSTPYSSLPEATDMPQTDHFTLDSHRMSVDGDTEVPLPGHALRPGLPAPTNARLSMGLGLGTPATPTRQAQPTTTIRLVANQNLLSGQSLDFSYGAGGGGTPQLKPFKTTFDISFGSPAPARAGGGFGGTSIWPPRDDDMSMKGIYPTLTFEDLPPSMPASPTRAGPSALPVTASSPGPFTFGSPHSKDRVSDTQFRSAAASVLEEMNQRLRADGVDGIGVDIIAKLHPNASPAPARDIKPLPAAKRASGAITDKFEKAHSQEFDRMQGIDETVRRRAARATQANDDGEKVAIGKKRKSNALERGGGAGPRRPSAIAGRASTTRVISNGRRAKLTIPGGFGMDDDDDEEEEEDRAGKRVRMDPDAVATLEEQQKAEEAHIRRQEELEKEKEIIRKKLEANRARRRSSAAHGGPRKSLGRPRPSVLQKPKPKPSRFGFLSSAKSLVQNVWNRGKAVDPAPSNIPKPTPAAKSESGKEKEKMGPPSLGLAKKSAAAPARATATVATGSKVPSVHQSNATTAVASGKGSIASSSARSRSPLPNFNTASSSRNSILSTGTSRTSRSSLLSGPSSHVGTAASKLSRTSSANVSSVGTRQSSRLSATDTVGSMGAKKLAGGSSVTSRKSTVGSGSRLSVASRLFAPTASSLAKTHRTSTASSSGGPVPVPQNQARYQSPGPALGLITNSPAVTSPRPPSTPHGTFSPRPGGIFSTPLTFGMQSSIPTPAKKRPAPTEAAQAPGAPPAKLAPARSLNGRKPRISRSKVIARLASQREAGTSGTARIASGSSVASGRSGLAPRASGGGKTRSSLGAKAARASYGGGPRGRTSAGGAGGVALSAKKRARQSEYARRRSRVGPLNLQAGEGSSVA